MSEYTLKKTNGLSLCIDWISFVITKIESVEKALSLFGFSTSDFVSLDRGGYGYSKHLLLNGSNIHVFYEGSNPDMGIYVSISGTAISCFFETYKNTLIANGFSVDEMSNEDIMRSCLSCILSLGHFTRFDASIDDKGCNFFSIDDLALYYENNQVISCLRTYDHRRPQVNHKVVGNSLNFGRRSSNTFLRIYDKQLEQNKKANSEKKIDFQWVRYEFELKNKNADNFVQLFLNGLSYSDCVMGIMNKYFRIINLDNDNVSRCSVLEKWAAFTQCIFKLRLSIPHEQKSLDEKERWIEQAAMKTIVALLIRDGGSLDFISKKIPFALHKLARDKRLCAELGGKSVVTDAIGYYCHNSW